MSSHNDLPPLPDDRRRREAEIHAALLAGAEDASYDAFTYFRRPLLRRLQASFPALRDDPDLEGCLLEALNEYFLRPDAYQAERGSLYGHLYRAAHRDALNLMKSRSRRPEEITAPEKVAELKQTRKEAVEREALGEVDGLPEGVELRDLEARLRSGLRPEDRPILPLVLSERAPLESYVQALGLEGLPREEQERRVKLAKDRVHTARARLRERYRDDR